MLRYQLSSGLCVCVCVRATVTQTTTASFQLVRVCLNGRHHREPVHLFNQSLTGGEYTHPSVCLTPRGGQGREPSDWTLGGMTFTLLGVSSQLGTDIHILFLSLSCHLCLSLCLGLVSQSVTHILRKKYECC